MSFRHVVFTEYLYRTNEDIEVVKDKFSKCVDYVHFQGQIGETHSQGYFHGVCKDSDGVSLKKRWSKTYGRLMKNVAKIKIMYE